MARGIASAQEIGSVSRDYNCSSTTTVEPDRGRCTRRSACERPRETFLQRLGRSRELANELRRELDPMRGAREALRQGATSLLSHGVALVPLHAVYVASRTSPPS